MLFKKLFTLLLIVFSVAAYGQRIVINGKETTRPLKWEDFSGSPDKSSSRYAYTYWDITCQYDAFFFKGDTAKWKVIVTVTLGKKSWRKSDKVTDTLLKHEQGHFNLGILCAIELQQRIDNTVFLRGNYESALAAIVKEIIDKYKSLETKYDEETNHFANREQQWKWDQFFSDKIK